MGMLAGRELAKSVLILFQEPAGERPVTVCGGQHVAQTLEAAKKLPKRFSICPVPRPCPELVGDHRAKIRLARVRVIEDGPVFKAPADDLDKHRRIKDAGAAHGSGARR